jgi:hypothetical protein
MSIRKPNISKVIILSIKIKIQHYVPKFYLKSFSTIRNNNLYCFDKFKPKYFLVNIKKIGCEKYFYDTSIDTNQLVEKGLAQMESLCNIAYNKLIKKGKLECLTEDDKYSIAILIATQQMRTKKVRGEIKANIKRLTEFIPDKVLTKELEEELKDANTEESIKSMQIDLIADYQLSANILFKMKWILLKNETTMPYWTSDHPITLYNPVNQPFNLGLLCTGIQIRFPLNPKLCLCLCDPNLYCFYPDNLKAENVQNIIFQNSLQFIYSKRHIFSNNNDFSLAEKMINKNRLKKDNNKNK